MSNQPKDPDWEAFLARARSAKYIGRPTIEQIRKEAAHLISIGNSAAIRDKDRIEQIINQPEARMHNPIYGSPHYLRNAAGPPPQKGETDELGLWRPGEK